MKKVNYKYLLFCKNKNNQIKLYFLSTKNYKNEYVYNLNTWEIYYKYLKN